MASWCRIPSEWNSELNYLSLEKYPPYDELPVYSPTTPNGLRPQKVHPLRQEYIFLWPVYPSQNFKIWKRDFANSAISFKHPSIPLIVETDASDSAIADLLWKFRCLVDFFSKKNLRSQRRHSAIEKELCAIVEALRK